ncbi:glycosyltransferase family 2 protein, partial [Candidatus Woesearchaeota archaeon]|nr:glycosyltransferase family 2 protein [Candidatus Woesearchaeota archaeon]
EVIVVDNNSKRHNPCDIQNNHPQVQFIANMTNVGFGRANNQAIALAKGDFILVMNPDVILERTTLPELITYLNRHPHVKIAAPKLLNHDGSVQHSCRTFPTPAVSIIKRTGLQLMKNSIAAYEMQDYDHETPLKVDWASGACLLLRGKQYFDDRYFLYFEDVDLCKSAGEVHYVPIARATHLGQYASRTVSTAFVHHTASMIKYYAKWGWK